MKTKPWIIMILLWAVWGMPVAAHAHRVNIFAWVEGDTVYTQSKFGGGRKAMNAPVEVYDDQDTKLLEGRTDENGEFSFIIPKKSALKIVLAAGTGHRSQWVVPLEEIEEAAAPVPDPPKASSAPIPAIKENKRIDSSRTALTGQPNEAMVRRIEAAVEKAVERKLHPLARMLAEATNKGPDLKDILGGIGYILGLVGIAAYVQSRKEKRR